MRRLAEEQETRRTGVKGFDWLVSTHNAIHDVLDDAIEYDSHGGIKAAAGLTYALAHALARACGDDSNGFDLDDEEAMEDLYDASTY